MAWVKLDDQFPEHPKVAQTGPLAMAMQVAALCYSNRKLTDGFIPRSIARTLLDFEVVEDDVIYTISVTSGMSGQDVEPVWVIGLLVDSGMWDEVPGGYQIHDYHDYQPSKAEILAERKQRSDAGKKGAASRWDGTGHGASHNGRDGTRHDASHGTRDGKWMAKPCPVPVPVPVPERQESTPAPATPTPPKRGHRLPDTFRLTDDMRSWAAEKHPSLDVDEQTERFRDYWRAESGAKASKLDWVAAWRTWMSNAEKWSARSPRSKLERNLAAIDSGVAAVNR